MNKKLFIQAYYYISSVETGGGIEDHNLEALLTCEAIHPDFDFESWVHECDDWEEFQQFLILNDLEELYDAN